VADEDSIRVVDAVLRDPAVAEVLADYGIVFCPGCYVLLTSTLEEAAGYNAVQDVPAFLRRLADVLEHAGHAAG
jgi:hypothetical protein